MEVRHSHNGYWPAADWLRWLFQLFPQAPPDATSHFAIALAVRMPRAAFKSKVKSESRHTSGAKQTITNRTRCQLYRDQRQKYEHSLVAKVAALKEELTALDRGFWQERAIALRQISRESLDRTMREYFTRFKHGLGVATSMLGTKDMTKSQRLAQQNTYEHIRAQENFLRCLMDPRVVMGGLVGVEPMIAMMRRATAAYADFHQVLSSLKVLGSSESPMVVARVMKHAVLTRESFQMYLPGAAGDADLLRKYLHSRVAFESTMTFHFTREGRVRRVNKETCYIAGLIKAGWSIADVARAMPSATALDMVAAPKFEAALSATDSRGHSFSGANTALAVGPTRKMLLDLVSECCQLFQIRVGEVQPEQQQFASSQAAAREAFLRRVLSVDVAFGDVVGLNAVVELWLHWVQVLADVRKQITGVSIVGADNAPVLIVSMTSWPSSRLVTSVAAEMKRILPWTLLDTELRCCSQMQFHFTQDARVSCCSMDNGFAEALRVAGLGLAETSRVLQWFSPTQRVRRPAATAENDQQETSPQRHTTKSNRERSLKFRRRQKQSHLALERSVQALQATVWQLKTRLKQLAGGSM